MNALSEEIHLKTDCQRAFNIVSIKWCYICSQNVGDHYDSYVWHQTTDMTNVPCCIT